MVAYLPLPGGHIKLAERFVDPAFSFTMVRSLEQLAYRNFGQLLTPSRIRRDGTIVSLRGVARCTM